MTTFRRIPAATALLQTEDRVVGYATALAGAVDADLHFVHVVEPLPVVYGGDPKEAQARPGLAERRG